MEANCDRSHVVNGKHASQAQHSPSKNTKPVFQEMLYIHFQEHYVKKVLIYALKALAGMLCILSFIMVVDRVGGLERTQ